MLRAILIFTLFARLVRFPLSKTHKQNGVRAIKLQQNVEKMRLCIGYNVAHYG